MNMNESLGLKGFLKIIKKNNDGSTEVLLDDENVITDAAKQAQLVYLYNASATIFAIDSFRVGDEGTFDVEGQNPKSPDGSETGLYAAVALLDSTNINYTTPTVTSVVFSFDVLTSEANGQLISEVGLFKSNDDMFNIKTFVAIPKNSTFSLHFEWTIRYA